MSYQFQTADIVEANSLVTPGESIMVVSTTDPASVAPVSIKPNDDLDGVEALKRKFNELKWKYDECLKDNVLLKNQCDYLNKRLEDLKRTEDLPDYAADFETFENNESIVAYVEVSNICLSNKIETYLAETNNIFTGDKVALFDSMAFFIKNMWSLIAHKYSENSLEQSQLIKGELIDKLMNAKQEYIKISEQSSRDQQTIMHLKVDTEEFKSNSEVIRSKILEQNEDMKKLINQLEILKSYSMTSDTKSQDQAQSIQPSTSGQEAKEEVVLPSDDETTFSPGSSPSSFFLNRFQKKLGNLRKSKSSTSTETVKNSKLTPQEATNEFYICNIQNDFIAIDKTLDRSNEMIKSSHVEAAQSTDSFSTLTSDTSSTVCSLFTCDNCRTSVDAAKLDKPKVDKHNRAECKTSHVCMFCLQLFDKSLQQEFEEHVRSHISLNTCDT